MNKADLTLVNRVEKYRSELLRSRTIIEVRDLGAGSLKMTSDRRRVSDIARNSASRKKYAKLLSKLAATVNGKPVLELGTSLGISTMYLALSAPDSLIYTIEGCDMCADIAAKGFQKNGLTNILQFRGDFDRHLEAVLKESETPGLVFIDGNHKSDPLLRYMELILKYSDKDTIIVLDDIHYSKDMEKGWMQIKGLNILSICIDINQFGLVFMKKGIRKQDFVIRY